MRHDERGIALVITLFLMASLSALAVSLMFLSQTETAATRNYRTMSQARYAGEGGVHKAINYLNSVAYTAQAINYANYGLNKSPVTCLSGCPHTKAAGQSCDASTVATAISSGCIVLVANYGGFTSADSNYPDSTVVAGYNTAAQGTLAVNSSGLVNNLAVGTVSYGTAAILMSMRSFNGYGTSTLAIQQWQIVGDGTAGQGTSLATVGVMGSFEKSVVPAETFAVFATNSGCGAITYVGNGGTYSYNSNNALAGNSKPVLSQSGGSVGTNGNLSLGGTVDVYGNLSTPRTGVGSCEEGAVTALTETGGANLSGETIHLPQAKSYPTPVIPPAGTVDLDFSSSFSALSCQTTLASLGWGCSVSGNTFTLTPAVSNTLSIRNLNIGSNKSLVIAGTGTATINANSFTTAGNSGLSITNSVTTLNLQGTGVDPVMDMQGSFSTTSFDPAKLQIMYAGTGTIKLRGNNELAATIYAPNSHVDMSSSYDVYGSILAGTYTNSGGAKVHYDTALATKYYTISNPFMSTFTWKKY